MASIMFLAQLLFLFYSSCLAVEYGTHQDVLHQSVSKYEPATNRSCSLWKYDKYNNSSCECGDDIHGIVSCRNDQPTLFLLTCHCMSYSDHGDMVLVGACQYLCTHQSYTEIPEYTNLNDLCNNVVQQNREGQMCGRCTENHSPSPYSYMLRCAHCSDHKHNWIKYLVIAYLPLTVFFIAVIFFRFNAMSPPLNTFISFCQIISCPAVASLLSTYVYFTEKDLGDQYQHNINVTLSAKALSTVYGFWNLDFFRMVYSPFCLHPNMSILQVKSLDYAIALYPLCLVGLTYLLVKLHDKFKVIRLLWKPMAYLYIRLNHQWKVSDSLIEAFGTFFLLSYVKVINTSFDILIPVQLYNISGQAVGLYTFYNGSLVYFGRNHVPYAIIAIFMFITFNLIPLLLLFLYPCRCFQSCLNFCRLNSQVLRTFMDAFQGCYRFEPYDCRYWAAFYPLLRIIFLAIFALTPSVYFVIVTGILLITVTALVAVVQPYRQTMYNVVDTLFFLAFVLLCFSISGLVLSASYYERYQDFASVMVGIALMLPLIYVTVLVVIKILPNKWTAHAKKFLWCMYTKLCRDREQFQIHREIEEDPLLQHLADSEAPLLLRQNTPRARYKSLLDDYTAQ